MAGGIGSRFWPVSTPERPKQFIDILGIGNTMLQTTVNRFSGVIPKENIWVVTSKKYASIVSQQIEGISNDHILLEPCMRNTAPCIAYVSYKIRQKYPHANLVVSPADHIIIDEFHFRDVISKALDFTSSSDSIVTLGMNPDRPETGYGYIKSSPENGSDIVKVLAFKEKPDIELAKKYIAEGHFYWNAGIFVWNVDTVISSFEKYSPSLAAIFDSISKRGVFYSDTEQDVIDNEFPSCPNISIDYAIMEKSDKVFVYPSSFGWSDLGTWGSLYQQLDKDDDGNAKVGEGIKLINCHNCIVHSAEESNVVIQGLDGYIVVEKGEKLLICKISEEQNIKAWSTSK